MIIEGQVDLEQRGRGWAWVASEPCWSCGYAIGAHQLGGPCPEGAGFYDDPSLPGNER